MASKKDLFKKKAIELTTIHNTPKPTALGAFNDIERVKSAIEVLPELKAFIRPLTHEQFTQLEQNIIAHGCQDALVLWETSDYELGRGEAESSVYVLIDGHNRYQICKKNGIDFKIMLKVFTDMEAVKEYMIDLQIGRRNLTLEEESYYRGLKYNAQKGSRGVALQLAQTGKEAVNIAENLAEQFNVTSRTIKNDGKFAQGLNKLSPELRNEVLQGKSKISKKNIQELANTDYVDNSIGSFNELINEPLREERTKPLIEKEQLIIEIRKLCRNLKTKKNCDLLIEKANYLKVFMNEDIH